MQGQTNSLEAMFAAWLRRQYGMLDFVRRMQGDALSALGFGPTEAPYRVIASGQHWRLRDYSDHPASQGILVIAAPIKRPYIWDLTPSVSPLRYCLAQRLGVYLLEWLPASRGTQDKGLDECASAISECVAVVSREIRGAKPFMIGHSLGGTLAAIASALAPDSIQGLVLLGAPLSIHSHATNKRQPVLSHGGW